MVCNGVTPVCVIGDYRVVYTLSPMILYCAPCVSKNLWGNVLLHCVMSISVMISVMVFTVATV